MEEISKVLKLFFDNHFIPAVVALVFSLLSVLALPSDFWAIEKLGDSWFCILLFGIFFLLIITAICAKRKISSCLSLMRYRNKNRKEEENRIIQEWKNVFNHMDKEHLDIIRELVKNNNIQIEKPYFFHSSMQDYFIPSDNRLTGIGGGEAGDFQNAVFICTTKYKPGNKKGEMKMVRVYKLQDNAFRIAKHLLDTEGKLSVYDDFDQEIKEKL